MRIIGLLLFFSLLSAWAYGQVKPKSNPPVPVVASPPLPLPPPPPPKGTAGTTGLLLLKIPVTGNYYLGMERKEFDSIRKLSALTVKTEKAVYTVSPSTYFLGKRLLYLDMEVDSNFFSAAGADITAQYETKLGPPDDKEESDTLVQFPLAYDSSLNGQYRVKAIYLTWHLKHHDIYISAWMADLRNGSWKGAYTIRYAGNTIFRNMLQELAYREGY
jgi:hypothetical protein